MVGWGGKPTLAMAQASLWVSPHDLFFRLQCSSASPTSVSQNPAVLRPLYGGWPSLCPASPSTA